MHPQMSANHECASASSARKPYVAPEVVEYGSLADITLTVGSNGKVDGGASPPNKTRVLP